MLSSACLMAGAPATAAVRLMLVDLMAVETVGVIDGGGGF